MQMTGTNHKKYNISSNFLLKSFFAIISIKIIYMLFGQMIIQAIYNGKLSDYFNQIIYSI